MLKVSVVVAVYNPGPDIDELLASIDAQTLPAAEFEVIFADDDSTDGTRERLREWAEDRRNVSVLHNTPNSGWPGRPRNLGIDAARGEYLFFADNDDKFTPDALRAMYDFARAHDSDVVIPKEIGVGPGRSVSRALFRRDIPDATLGRDPILLLLTPHKLVRTALVHEHGIRFPEGRVRLEDHFFMMSCYFAAQRISVFAQQPCYYWMRRQGSGENASFSEVDPVVYYESVERVLAVVEANTEPGAFRDKLYSHWYQTKMLARLRGGFLLEHAEDYQERLVAELRRVSVRFGFDERLLPYLGAGSRARAQLLMTGSLEDIRRLAAAERGITQQPRLEQLSWTDDGRLALSISSHFVYADGDPITVIRTDHGAFWDITPRVPGLRLDPVDVSDLVAGIRLHTLLTDRSTSDVQFASGHGEPLTDDRLGVSSEVLIDPGAAFRSRPVDTVLDLRVRLNGLGWWSEIRLPADGGVRLPATGPQLEDRTVVAFATTGRRKLSLHLVDPTRSRWSRIRELGRADGWREASPVIARAALRRARHAAGRVRTRIGELRP